MRHRCVPSVKLFGLSRAFLYMFACFHSSVTVRPNCLQGEDGVVGNGTAGCNGFQVCVDELG